MFKATYRRVRAVVVAVAIVIGAGLVSTVAIDLGPALKKLAEERGSEWIDRPMHIGRLSVRLAPGRFVIEDLRIDGTTPDKVMGCSRTNFVSPAAAFECHR